MEQYTLERLIGELKSSTSKKLEDWKSLEKDLKKRKLCEYEHRIKEVSIDEAGRVLSVLKKLEERFEYGQMLSRVDLAGGSCVQFDRILEISRTEGDVCKMLDTLADLGYKLNGYKDGVVIKYLTPKDVTLFKKILEYEKPEKLYETIKVLKRTLGYENMVCSSSNNSEIENLIGLTKIEGDVTGVICLLANEGYTIDKETDLSDDHVKTIEEIANMLEKENSDYLYKKLKPELFKEYFSSISLEKKKKTLEKIFESEHQNEEIIRWLDNNYSDLMREVSFKD